MPGPLHGFKVIDCTASVMGPSAAQQLGDLGADVIKIEPPEGDGTRTIGPSRNRGMSAFFLGFNRNKRSIVLDLKQESAKAALRALVRDADVFITNQRPKPASRLGIDYGALEAINPKLVYLTCYGYRADGPYADRPAYDDIIQAGSGLSWLLESQTGVPRYVPTIMADKISGAAVANAILAALLARERTGMGQAIEVPMFETMVAFITGEHMYGATFVPPLDDMGYRRIMSAERRPYRTKDGYIALLPYSDRHWLDLCRIAGRMDIIEHGKFNKQAARFHDVDEFYSLVAEMSLTKTNAEWSEALQTADIPFGLVNSLEDLIEEPQLKATDFWTVATHPSEGELRFAGYPARFSRTKPEMRLMQPRLGEHTREILGEAGIQDDVVQEMLATGATYTET